MQIVKLIKFRTSVPNFEKRISDESSKTCLRCEQGKIPFRYGICFICGLQVSGIQYLTQPYKYFSLNHDNVKMGITEVYQGLDEMEIPD